MNAGKFISEIHDLKSKQNYQQVDTNSEVVGLKESVKKHEAAETTLKQQIQLLKDYV